MENSFFLPTTVPKILTDITLVGGSCCKPPSSYRIFVQLIIHLILLHPVLNSEESVVRALCLSMSFYVLHVALLGTDTHTDEESTRNSRKRREGEKKERLTSGNKARRNSFAPLPNLPDYFRYPFILRLSFLSDSSLLFFHLFRASLHARAICPTNVSLGRVPLLSHCASFGLSLSPPWPFFMTLNTSQILQKRLGIFLCRFSQQCLGTFSP